MITLLTGSNSFEIAREVARLAAVFGGTIEKIEGKSLTMESLPQLVSGATLFSEKRLVVINDLSDSASVWSTLPEWIGQVSSDTDLVLVESSPDKRTRAYKAQLKLAEVKEFQLLTERDAGQAERWVLDEAKRLGAEIEKPAARALLQRSMVASERGQPTIDQWQVFHSLEKLSALGAITVEKVEKYIDPQPVESVFSVFETALRGDMKTLRQLLADLEPREDPYKVFGLLSSQVFQLAVLSVSDEPSAVTAKAIGVHPFAVGKLTSFADRLNKKDIRQIVYAFRDADEAMKTSKGAPWTLIEQALMKVAAAVSKK